MKQNLEIEYKTLLTEDEYKRLQEYLDFSDAKKQVNFYYDTIGNELLSKSMMVRVRVTDEYEFTLKIPQKDGVLEVEQIVPDQSIQDNDDVKKLLETYGFDATKLVVVAKSTTYRQEFHDIYGVWCLDYTDFGHSFDFEIEYELDHYDESALPHYVSTLEKLNIKPLHEKPRPKYIRARFPQL